MAEVPDRDRLAMISELAQASGIAGMCGGQALIWKRKAIRLTWRRWSVFIAIKPAHYPRRGGRMGALSAGEAGRKALPASIDTPKISVSPSRSRMTFSTW